jgi:hypothetical protein
MTKILHKYKETGMTLHKSLCGIDTLKTKALATAWVNGCTCKKCLRIENAKRNNK